MTNRRHVGILAALILSVPAASFVSLLPSYGAHHGNHVAYVNPYHGHPHYYPPVYNNYGYRGYAPYVAPYYGPRPISGTTVAVTAGLAAVAGAVVGGLLASQHGHSYD